LVATSRTTSQAAINPKSWAVFADIPMTTVKLPAAGVLTLAAGLG
jgi:hypothetical protein